MLNDRDLAQMLLQLQNMERETRVHMKTDDIAERDHAIGAMRLVTASRRSVETWISLRALRAQMQTPVHT